MLKNRPNRFNMYLGWHIDGRNDYWEAHRFGVRMRANSQELIKTMIDLRPPLQISFGKS
jgi:hypothetical protein